MRFRYLVPLVVALLVVACGGTDRQDFSESVSTHETGNELSAEQKLEVVLHVVNDLSRDELLTLADVEPELADAIVDARAQGVRFTTEEQVDDLLTRSLPATNPMCSYYEGLAQYYAIRALQCAYSACYSMVPWYGHMAEYYSGLVQVFCTE